MLVQDEHLQINGFLKNLRSTCFNLDNQHSCKNCTSEKHAACQGRLVSAFYNAINIVTNHFDREESIMLKPSLVTEQYEVFYHQQAHSNILNELNAKVSQCALLDADGETSEAFRQLYGRMLELFKDRVDF